MAIVNIKDALVSWLKVITQGSDPATPATGYGLFYDKSKSPYFINSDGVVIPLNGRNDYVLVREEQAANTAGGTFTSGSWVTRVINTEVYDTGSNCTLPGSNVIRLLAGTYEYRISCPASFVAGHKCRLYDVTAGAIVTGSNGTTEAANTNPMNTRSVDTGRFTITSTNDFRVEHQAQVTCATTGLGQVANLGANEVYSVAEFWRIA